jgi:hypothetical protein
MNTFLKYTVVEKYMPALLAAITTSSIAFGFWSAYVSAPLHG